MKILFVLSTMFALTLSIDPSKCTTAVKDFVDDIFELVIDIQEKGFDIDSKPIDDVMKGSTEFLNDCLGKDVDITKYDHCVESMMPVLPLVEKLVNDIKSGQTNNIMLDVSQIGLQLASGITNCVQNPTHMIAEYKL